MGEDQPTVHVAYPHASVAFPDGAKVTVTDDGTWPGGDQWCRWSMTFPDLSVQVGSFVAGTRAYPRTPLVMLHAWCVDTSECAHRRPPIDYRGAWPARAAWWHKYGARAARAVASWESVEHDDQAVTR